MNNEVISFFDNFKCLAAECPENCCRAWDMPVDSETLEHYRSAKGQEGFKLRLTLTRNREGDIVMRTPFGKCCNLKRDGLCRLHALGRMELMPKVCRIYPRNTVSYGDYVYGMLDLSCIAVARMFAGYSGRIVYTDAPKDIPVYWEINDVYEDFVSDLRTDLDRVLDFLWDGEDSLWIKESLIFAHAYGMHQYLVRDDTEGARCVPFDMDEIREICSDNLPQILEIRTADIDDGGMPFFPMSFVNELIYQNIPDYYLASCHPKLSRLIKSYKRQFGGLTESGADSFFKGRWDDICEKYSWLSARLKSYFSYKLQMNYLNASIDYYMLEPVLLSMINIQFLMLFIITEDGEGKTLTLDYYAELMSENERLISHNKVFNSEIMAKIRRELMR